MSIAGKIKIKFPWIGSCFRWGNNQHGTNLPQSRNVREDYEKALMVAIILITYDSQKYRNQSCTARILTNSYENQKAININCGIEIVLRTFLFCMASPSYILLHLSPASMAENTINKRSKRDTKRQVSLDSWSGYLSNLAFFMLSFIQYFNSFDI